MDIGKTNAKRPDNGTVGNTIMSLRDYKQGQLHRLWQGTLSSPYRPYLLSGHRTTPLNVTERPK